MSSEDEADSIYDSSTVVSSHEPFETYKARVLQLCQTVLTPAADQEIPIQRKHGGGFNRIIGISITSNDRPTTSQYILRIPRFDAARLGHDLAPLLLLRQHSKLTVPDVVAYDITGQNARESPYMIQTRIPGSPLSPIYVDLSHGTKCAIARDIGDIYSELHLIRSVTAGKLILLAFQGLLMIEPFEDMRTDLTGWCPAIRGRTCSKDNFPNFARQA